MDAMNKTQMVIRPFMMKKVCAIFITNGADEGTGGPAILKCRTNRGRKRQPENS